jgi:hypothetical protein
MLTAVLFNNQKHKFSPRVDLSLLQKAIIIEFEGIHKIKNP